MSITLLQLLPLSHFSLPSSLYPLVFIVSFTKPGLYHFSYLSHHLHISPLPAFYSLISFITSLLCLSKFLLVFLLSLINFLSSSPPSSFFLHLPSTSTPFLSELWFSSCTHCSTLFSSTKGLWMYQFNPICSMSCFRLVLNLERQQFARFVKAELFATSWLAMSLCSYFRKSSLKISLSKVPDLDFNSQYVSQHRVFLAPALKNNFGIDTRLNYCKHLLMTLYFSSDHPCLDLHLELNFKIDLARKANTRLASTRISHETPRSRQNVCALHIGLLV